MSRLGIRRVRHAVWALASWISLAGLFPASAQSPEIGAPLYDVSGSDWGGIGLLQTRTARAAADGDFEIGFSRVFPYNRFVVTWQIMPRIETTFRFSAITNSPLIGSSNNENFKDRGFDVKLSIFDETKYTPAIAMGTQDFLGTGVFASEYIVASKRFWDLDVSMGLLWGYGARNASFKNPFRLISKKFKNRSRARREGGTFNFGNFFAGEQAAIFGGVEYHTPVRGLTIKAEYDSNDYKNEPRSNRFEQKSPVNIGVQYRPFSWLDTSVAFERGTSIMLRGSLRYNFHKLSTPKTDPPPVPIVPRHIVPAASGKRPDARPRRKKAAPMAQPARRRLSSDTGVDALFDGLERQGLEVLGVDINGDEATVLVSSADGPLGYLALRQAAQAVYRSMPVQLENVVFVQLEGEQERGRVALSRRDAAGMMAYDWLDAPRAPEETTPPAPSGIEVAAAVFPDKEALAARIAGELREHDFKVDAVEINRTRITVFVRPQKYVEGARNIGRAARIIANAAPPSVEEISVALTTRGLDSGRVTLLRTAFERAVLDGGSPEEVWPSTIIEPGQGGPSPDAIFIGDAYPDFTWSLRPVYRQSVGGGDVFFTYQFLAALSAQVILAPGLRIVGTVSQNIKNNFDKFRLGSDSVLPRVRSNIREYLKEGTTALSLLEAEYLFAPRKNWYGRLFGGFLDIMYAGAGAEVLYRPVNARWGISADAIYVKQRSFKSRLGFRDYQTVTAHVAGFYELPYSGLGFSVIAGRYLARDWGGTISIARNFDSGVQVGAFATFTTVPFSEFGEGSFDKGFHITIPFNAFMATSTRRRGTFAFRPLTRDGGQLVGAGKKLFGLTHQGSYGFIAKDWDALFD